MLDKNSFKIYAHAVPLRWADISYTVLVNILFDIKQCIKLTGDVLFSIL